MLNFVFLVLGVGGAIVGALTLADPLLKWEVIVFFGLMGMIGFGLIVNDWWKAREVSPAFNLSILALHMNVPGDLSNSTGLVLLVTLGNDGGSSIAKDWALAVTIPGQEAKQARFMRLGLQTKLTLDSGDGKKLVIIPGTEALEAKSGNSPVIGEIQGYLWFILDNVPKNVALNPKTALVLSVKDKTGKSHSTSATLEEIERR
jgi:hypothetical protein